MFMRLVFGTLTIHAYIDRIRPASRAKSCLMFTISDLERCIPITTDNHHYAESAKLL